MSMSFAEISVVFLAFLLGGIMKGATGVGVPIVAVPVIATYLGLQEAIGVVLLPNLVANGWQVWQNRKAKLPNFLIWSILIGATLGIFVGVFALMTVSVRGLNIGLAVAVLVFVASRLMHPQWSISSKSAPWIAPPAVFFGGMMQGATGISGPAVVMFSSALGLPRAQFLMAMSLTFFISATTQMPAMITAELFGPRQLLMGALALIPMLLGMRLGERILLFVSAKTFDVIILVLLIGLAMKLLYSSLVG